MIILKLAGVPSDALDKYVENSKGLYSMKQSLKEIIEDDNKKRSEEIFYKFLY